jgi:hypothetical protein
LARLSASEFHELIHELVKAEGIAKLQEKLLRSHVLVSRRRIGTVDALARQLYQLTLGLDREGIASQVLITLWEELRRATVSEEAAKQLEDIAEKINRCLDPGNVIDPGKKDALRDAVAEYRAVLRERVGDAAARLTMVMRALPSVVAIVREDTQGS